MPRSCSQSCLNICWQKHSWMLYVLRCRIKVSWKTLASKRIMSIFQRLDKRERIIELPLFPILPPSLCAKILIQMHSVRKNLSNSKNSYLKTWFLHMQGELLVLHSFKWSENPSSILSSQLYHNFFLKLFTASLCCVIRHMCAWHRFNHALFGTETVPWTQIHALLLFFPFISAGIL